MVCRSVNSGVKCDLAKQRARVTLLQQQLKLLWSFFKKAPLLSVSPRMLGFNLSDERFEHKYDIFAVRRQLNTVTTEGRLNHDCTYIYLQHPKGFPKFKENQKLYKTFCQS